VSPKTVRMNVYSFSAETRTCFTTFQSIRIADDCQISMRLPSRNSASRMKLRRTVTVMVTESSPGSLPSFLMTAFVLYTCGC
jgi:hypothetical protein